MKGDMMHQVYMLHGTFLYQFLRHETALQTPVVPIVVALFL